MNKLGSLKKFTAWLSGGYKKKDDVDPLRKTITSLKIFNKRLQRQVVKMEQKGKLAKKKAIQRRESGDIPGSRLHMKNHLQFQKWVHSIENFRVRLDGVQFKLEQAKAIGDFTGVAKDIAGVLGELQISVKAPEISNMLSQLDLGFGNMDAIFSEVNTQLELSEDSSATSVTDEEVDNALAEVDAQLSINTREALPSVPGGASFEGEINDLEAEIKKLKQQRD